MGVRFQLIDDVYGIIDSQIIQYSINPTDSVETIRSKAEAAINAYGASISYSVSSYNWSTNDIRNTSALSLSVQTGTGATGTQVSATRDADVNVGVTIVTAATLASGTVGTMVLEVAPTNSATAGDWVEVGRVTNGQVFSLAIAIGCTQTIAGQLNGFVPAGYYVKVRSISTTGTPTFSINSGRKTLL